MTKGIVIITP